MGKTAKKPWISMIRAIDEYRVLGVETTLALSAKYVMEHEAYSDQEISAPDFVANHFDPAKDE